MDEDTKRALHQLQLWWNANPMATMEQIVAAPETFSEIAGTEIGQYLLSPEVGRSIEAILELQRRIDDLPTWGKSPG